jgi:hypothetical protein
MDCAEIKVALGVIPEDRHPKWGYLRDKKVPPEVMSPMVRIGGVQVCYLTQSDARGFWESKDGQKRGMYMRAIAVCPQCGKEVAASRINQHAKVHD